MATTYQEHTGDGSDLVFIYPFPVLKTEDVKVALNGGLQAATKYTVSLSPAQIKFNNTSIDNTLQENTGAPKSGVKVRVFRNTEVDNPKGVFAAGSSIRAADLNNNVDQALYALQEEKDQPLWDVDFEGGTINGVTIGATTPAAGTFTNLTISNLDGTIIGANTAAAGTFTSVNLLDDQKIKLGSNGETEIYYDDSTLTVKTDHNQEFMVDDVVRFMINDGNDSVQTSWPIVPMQDGEHDLGTANLEWRDLYIDGTAYLDAVDINDGNIDGTIIGANSAAAGTFTTGTITTADINGGNIDGTTIGATTPAQGSFSRLILNQNPSKIVTDTSDTSDDKSIIISAGGDTAVTRGS